MNASKLEAELNSVKAELTFLRAQQDFVTNALRVMFGVSGVWMSPQKASAFLGWSRDRIVDEIRLAERCRALGHNWHVQYGVHYRNDQSAEASEATWKVNVQEFYKLTQIPPDQIPALPESVRKVS
jgi:hypothetical protein